MGEQDRRANVTRETAETSVECTVVLDGEGSAAIETGIGFLDHMLEAVATHGLFDIEIRCEGDREVDEHHTVEDVAITLGEAVDAALGDRAGIARYADRRVPMDEALATVVVDISGRPGCYFEGRFSQERVGEFTSVLGRHFVESLATNAGITVHATVAGENAHHELEALFKGLARALDDATRIDERRQGAPSTKGTL